jgi:hypothetical protein
MKCSRTWLAWLAVWLLTNAFRQRWTYGQGKPNEQDAKKIMMEVYSAYPIPQLIGIPDP